MRFFMAVLNLPVDIRSTAVESKLSFNTTFIIKAVFVMIIVFSQCAVYLMVISIVALFE